jgi:hypothetical protein
VAPGPLGNQSRQGTSLRLATRPWLLYTGEYGGSGPPGKPGAPTAVGSPLGQAEGTPLRYGGLRANPAVASLDSFSYPRAKMRANALITGGADRAPQRSKRMGPPPKVGEERGLIIHTLKNAWFQAPWKGEAESEASVGGKPILRVSLQWYPTGPATRRALARVEEARPLPDRLLSEIMWKKVEKKGDTRRISEFGPCPRMKTRRRFISFSSGSWRPSDSSLHRGRPSVF